MYSELDISVMRRISNKCRLSCSNVIASLGTAVPSWNQALIQLDNPHSNASREEIISSSYRVDRREKTDVDMKQRASGVGTNQRRRQEIVVK